MTLLKFASCVLAFSAPIAMAQTSTWKSAPADSQVDFTVKHLGISNVHGRFGRIDATIVYDEKDVTKSTVSVTIDVSGLDTGEPKRDNDLKSEKFFDVAKNITASFASTSV